MKQKIETELVFAGDYVQFLRYVDGRRDKNYVYVKQPVDIMTRRGYKIVTIGTWHEKEANHNLLELAKSRLEIRRPE